MNGAPDASSGEPSPRNQQGALPQPPADPGVRRSTSIVLVVFRMLEPNPYTVPGV